MSEVYQQSATTDTLLSKYVGEPYRFQCPECDAHGVILRAKHGYPANYKEVDVTMYDRDEHVHDYRCKQCGAVFDEVYDKKHDEIRGSVHK
jgi:rubredoxin